MSKRASILLGIVLVFFSYLSTAVPALRPFSPFHVFGDREPRAVAPGERFHLTFTIDVPEGYYLYADDLDVDFTSLEGLIITEIQFPKPTLHRDPFLEREVEIYAEDVVVEIDGRVPKGLSPGSHELTALLHFRGCSPAICFRPEVKELSFEIDVEEGEVDPTPHQDGRLSPQEVRPIPVSLPERLGLKGLLTIHDFSQLLDRGIIFTIVVVFLAGVLTSLTPCVWPIIPLVLVYVGVHPHKRFFQNLVLSAILVSGIVLVYSLLGIGAAALGKNLGFLFQQRWFLVLVVIFFLSMSLSMFGVFDLRFPQGLQARLHALGGEGYLGAFLAGMGLGLVASPCSGPVLAAILGYVVLQGNYITGFLLLLVYGLGMGLFMILLGAGYGELAGKLKGGAWMLWIRRFLGILLLFPVAFYMGSLMHWGDLPSKTISKSAIHWLVDERAALEAAARLHRPIMIDFTAAWCPPCKALERKLFAREEIADLTDQLIPLRIDATLETDEVRRLLNKYRVVGWPTVIFLDPAGEAYRDLKVHDYDPTAVEYGMREVIRRTKPQSSDDVQGSEGALGGGE